MGILLQAVTQKQRYNNLGCGGFLRGAGSLGSSKSETCETCRCFWVDRERIGLDQGTPSKLLSGTQLVMCLFTWADYMLFEVPEGFRVDYGIRTEGNGPTVSSRIPCSISLYHTAAETTPAKLHWVLPASSGTSKYWHRRCSLVLRHHSSVLMILRREAPVFLALTFWIVKSLLHGR